jgi:hypothetical protein
MSAEARLAVKQHATGTDAEWRLLALLADEANSRGVVHGIDIANLAKPMGRKSIAGVKSKLKTSGQLVVIKEDDGEAYWIKLPGLAGPRDKAAPPPEPPPKVAGLKRSEMVEFTMALDGRLKLDSEIAMDAVEMLRMKRKVDSRIVTPKEMALAAVALNEFNVLFEHGESKGGGFGLGGNLTQVVMRVRDRPSWDAGVHVRLVQSAWRVRWWEKQSGGGRPTPNVIWSPKSFEQVVQDAKDEKEGNAQTGRRFTRNSSP